MSQILREVIPINVLGATNVGKTSLIQQYTNQYYETNTLSTIGYEFKMKNIKIKIDNIEKNVKLKIWDTSGQDIYFEQALITIKNCLGSLIVYDVSDKKSFQLVDKYLDNVYCKKDKKKFPIILIGNKCDLDEERKVSFEEGKKKADSYQIDFYETSAKNNINVENVFKYLTDKIVQMNQNEFLEGIDVNHFELKNNKDEKKKGNCCGNEKKEKNKI